MIQMKSIFKGKMKKKDEGKEVHSLKNVFEEYERSVNFDLRP